MNSRGTNWTVRRKMNRLIDAGAPPGLEGWLFLDPPLPGVPQPHRYRILLMLNAVQFFIGDQDVGPFIEIDLVYLIVDDLLGRVQARFALGDIRRRQLAGERLIELGVGYAGSVVSAHVV